jgi:hypothetical protein
VRVSTLLGLLGIWIPVAFAMGGENGEEGKGVRVGDAYAREDAPGRWIVGTGAVELALEAKDENFRIVGFRNKLVEPPREYITGAEAVCPLFTRVRGLREKFDVEVL